MGMRRGRTSKSPPVFSHEFVIQNHADITSCVAMVFVIGLMFQATSPVASLFVTLQHNITVNAEQTYSPNQVTWQLVVLSQFREYFHGGKVYVACSELRPALTRDGAYTLVGSLVSGTIATVRSFRDQPGENSRKVPQVMEDLTSQPFKFHEPTQRERDLFKTNVYDKFLGAVENNLQKRFPDIPMLESFGAFNIQQWPQDEAQLEDHGKESIQLLADHLHTILPLPEDVQAEYRLLKNAVKDDPQLGEQPTHKVLEEVACPLSEPLPNLATIASVGLLIPTSTADCERGFSTLSRVKTKLRNRMNDRTVNALLMISMEGPEVLDFHFNHAVTTWATSKTRRLKVL